MHLSPPDPRYVHDGSLVQEQNHYLRNCRISLQFMLKIEEF